MSCARSLDGRCCRPCWIGRLRESCDPLPVLAKIQSADLGEGEWKFGMKQETVKSLDPSAARIVAYLDGLPPSLRGRRRSMRCGSYCRKVKKNWVLCCRPCWIGRLRVNCEKGHLEVQMTKAKKTKENIRWWIGILASLALLLIFLNLQAVNSNLLNLDIKWLVIASIPLLIVLVRSNIIQKFKGFGIELETRLQDPISSINLAAIAALVDLPSDAKQSISYLERLSSSQRESIQRLTFQIERSGYYDERAIRFYLRELPNINFFEVVNSSGQFIALLPVDLLIERNNPNEEVLRRFIKVLETNTPQAFYREIAITKTILESDNILDALQQVRKSKFGYLPVISEDGRLLGIATRPMLESKVADEVLLTEGK